MINVQIETYMYALFLVMLVSIVAFALTIHSLKKDDFYNETMSLYKAYFTIGLMGWIIAGARDSIYHNINLSIPLIVYIGASLILLLAMDEKGRNATRMMTIGLFAILLIMIVLVIEGEYTKLLVQSVFGVVVYIYLFIKASDFAVKFRNIGYSIMAAAFLLAVVVSIAQLFSLLLLDNLTLAYTLAVIASSSGFILVGIGFLTSVMMTERNLLKTLTLKDPLTGMYNRRGLDYLIQLIIPASQRYKKCMSAITIDIDFFKKINDTYGHDGGDAVLKAFAALILECPRACDVSCRLGGEEFVVVLPETSLEGAIMIAERIRIRIVEMDVVFNDEIINLTASLGVASQCEDVNVDALLKAADKALYSAKAGGRNRVCYSDTEHNVVESEEITPDTCIRS